MAIIYLKFLLRSIEYKKHTNYNLIGMKNHITHITPFLYKFKKNKSYF